MASAAKIAPRTAGIPPPAAAAAAPSTPATAAASQMNPRPTILHQAMSAAPAAIPPAHMASTIGGEIWRPAGIAGTVEGLPSG